MICVVGAEQYVARGEGGGGGGRWIPSGVLSAQPKSAHDAKQVLDSRKLQRVVCEKAFATRVRAVGWPTLRGVFVRNCAQVVGTIQGRGMHTDHSTSKKSLHF